ncbi:MAG: Gfo/Idh/MocA family oxidoreductase [Trueperaceae bacterium]
MTGPASPGVMVLGAGEMGTRHARHWKECGGRIAAVFDPDRIRAEVLAARHGARALGQIEDGLALAEVEAVSVCTPTFLHAAHTIAALQAGKHVLCEKPAALTLEEALAMKEAAADSATVLRIGFMRRFDPAWQRILAFSRSIGRPLLAQATIAAGVRPKLLMHDAAANGGPIIDMCCHIFDQWGLLFGEPPLVVRAHGYTFSEQKPEVASIARKALDSAHLTLAYPCGGVGQVQVSWGLPSGIVPIERHSYIGPNGLLSVDWPDEVSLHGADGVTRWSSGDLDPWRAEIDAFAAEIRGDPAAADSGDPLFGRLATIDDGIAALRISLAVLGSVEGRCDVHPELLGSLTPADGAPSP